MTCRVGILTTHPIQYQVPWFRVLAKDPDIDLIVFFCMMPDESQQGDGFGVQFRWDIPLLDGYKCEVLENVATEPSLTNFRGCDTPGIRRIIKDRKFDAFIVNGWVVKSCLQLLFACRLYGVPCIVRGESNVMRRRPLWIRLVHRLLLKQYAAFLAIGKSNRDFYLNNGVRQEKIFMAPYGVDNDRLSSQADTMMPERSKIRLQWSIPEGAVTFLYCAKFVEKKRPLDLINALDLAVRRLPKEAVRIHLLMVGEGELRPECERIAATDKLPVTFTGFLNQGEIVKAYVAADCLVLPSDAGETWGLVVNEAMACGVPAIVSGQVGCHPDLIESGQTGEVFPCGDIERLADLLVSFALAPERLQEMGEHATRKVADYSVASVAEGCLEAVKYCMKGKNR